MYRTQYDVKNDSVTNSDSFEYHVAEKIQKHSYKGMCFYCPVCNHLNEPSLFISDWKNKGVIVCRPNKRVTIKGILFWKKKCPVAKFHTHYKCAACEYHTIVFDEKANSLIFSEIPI